jgi:hypothetical protein
MGVAHFRFRARIASLRQRVARTAPARPSRHTRPQQNATYAEY